MSGKSSPQLIFRREGRGSTHHSHLQWDISIPTAQAEVPSRETQMAHQMSEYVINRARSVWILPYHACTRGNRHTIAVVCIVQL